ncbi:centrobin [Plakobranchus ocellatus]|uniref:Centrobin n=1 Tax=Plakobranchus ocellatus TaxID=259542 RepID=A0AAV3Z7P4_9GAST|nr:centrobin [Plakobranchus ocellatus]
MDGSDQEATSRTSGRNENLDNQCDSNSLRSTDMENVACEEDDEREYLQQQQHAEMQDCLDAELEEPDGQRSSVNLDEDGGTHFEASQSQETVIRRVFPPPSAVPDRDGCESPSGPEIPGDNDVVFDPVQRLNFDDEDEDEEAEDVDEGVARQEFSPEPNGSASYDIAGDHLNQRPVVNGSEQGESARSLPFQSLHDHSQNVRIIEGHDSSFLDDAPQQQQQQQQQQPTSYGFNFLHTQMIQLPPHSASNASSIGNNGGSSPAGFPSNLHRALAEEEQAHNLYDSLEREDDSSPFGETNQVTGESSENLQHYFSSVAGGSLSPLATNTAGPPHQYLNAHPNHGDNVNFWEDDDNSDHGSYLSNSHTHAVTSDPVSSPQHCRHQSPPRNFQVELSATHPIPSADSVFLLGGRQGDGFNSPLEGDSGSQGEDDAQHIEEDNTELLNAELSEEGLLQDTQMYAQPVTAASNSINTAQSQRNVSRNGFQHVYNASQYAMSSSHTSQNISNLSRQQADNSSLHHPPPKNLARSQGQHQHQAVMELSAEGGGTCDGPLHGDHRHAAAGSSLDSKSVGHMSVANSSGGAIPKKSQPQAARAQQKRRPAVQGSASSGDTQRSSNAALKAASQPTGRKASAGTLGSQSGQKQGVSQRQHSAPNMGRGSASGATSVPFASSQGRQPQGKVTAVSPVASRTNSHTSLASTAGSTNSRVSGVGKESHYASSQKACGGGHLLSTTVQESTHSAFHMPNRDQGHSSASVGHLPTSSSATLPQQHKRDSGRSGWVNHQESGRKLQTVENEVEFQRNYSGSSQATHSQKPDHFQQGKMVGPANQQPINSSGNRIMRTTDAIRGVVDSKHLHRYNHGNPHYLGQAARQQPLQRNLANLSIQASVSSPPGSDGALPAGGSPSGSEGSHASAGRESVVSQMEALRKQGHRLSPADVQQSQPGSDVQGMEDVRNHLQNILSLGAGSFTGADQIETASDFLLSDQPVNRELNFDTDSSSFIGPSGPGNMSEILENFPTFSSKMFSSVPAGSGWLDQSGHSGIHSQQTRAQQLRDSLEKETYRRKHCEEHIQKLNTKLLEVQQQLAVAVSTDKRKDIMIEQLDKQLARVVEGWKKREAEKDEFLKTLSQEKSQIEEALQSQQVMINNFEVELAQTVDELKKEKERSAQTIRHLKQDIFEAEKAKESAEEHLDAEREKFQAMSDEWDSLKEAKADLEQRVAKAHEKLKQEQERWSLKEQELNNKIAEVKEATQKVINIEKVKAEEMKKKKEGADVECADLKSELKKAVLDMEQLLREKESQKVEMSIMEAKFESAQRKLEADLHAQMEKEIADQASEFHARLDSTVEEMSERHRRQVSELHQRQQRDLAQQAAAINDQRDQKDEEFRHQIADLEEKLQEMRTENSALRQSKLKLESQRMEILSKLQLMMQSQWNEAVSLLVNTPQKKQSLNSSFLSSNHSGGQLASALAATDGNASVTSFNLLTSSMGGVGSAARSGGGDGHSGLLPQFSKKASSPSAQLPTANGGAEVERETRSTEQAREDVHAELDRMERVEDYLQSLSQHMDIPMKRNDLHHAQSDTTTTSVSSTATNTTTASNNISLQQQQQRQSLAELVADRKEQQDPQQKARPGSAVSSPGPHPGPQPVHTQVHGYITGLGGQRIITGATADSAQSERARVGFESQQQAVAMRSPQQSSSRPHAEPEFEAASSAYNPGGRNGQDNSYKLHYSHQHPHVHNDSNYQHYHQRPLPHLLQHQWEGHRSLPSNMTREGSRQNSHHLPMYSSLTSSPQAQNQQRLQREQMSPPSSQHHAKVFSKNAKERNSASNINIYTPGSPTYTSSPDVYDKTSPHDQWSPVNGRGAKSQHLSATEGSRSPVKKPSQRQFSSLREMGRLNESLSPPVKQTAEQDRTHTDSVSEEDASFHDPTRLQANYSHLSDKVEEHQSRQGELQYFVRMLLSKAPGSVCSEPERDAVSEPSVLESSRDLTVDLDLNDTATALEVTTQLSRLQELREKEHTLRGLREGAPTHPLPPHVNRPRPDHASANLSELFDSNGVISAQGLTEISQLLVMYREQWEANPEAAEQGNVAGQLMEALRGMTGAVSSDHAKPKLEVKIPVEAKVSPKNQRTRKVKKTLNGSQSSGDLNLSANPDTSLVDKASSGRVGSGLGSGPGSGPGAAASARRKVAGSGKASVGTTLTAALHHNHQHPHNHHNNHSHHQGEGHVKDKKAGSVGTSQGKATGGGAKGGGGASGPVWK